MKFVVDAQLPRRMALWLREHGHDALHTLDLPDENRTSDAEIVALAIRDGRVVVTKDADFVESFILHHRPEKLLLIATGNITNGETRSAPAASPESHRIGIPDGRFHRSHEIRRDGA